jgi:hypothetical protein
MKTQLLGALLALSITTPFFAAINETPVTYNDGKTTMKGFVVYDTAKKAKQPGIVMVPEWWGITKHMHNEARRLARQGYTAFIADMYGDGRTADNPDDAGALSDAVMKSPQAMESRFNAARAQLAKQPTVDPTRIGAVGYCFGGAVVLNIGEGRFRSGRRRGLPRFARSQYASPRARHGEGEDPDPEWRRRSVREEGAVRCVEGRHGCGEGRLPRDRISRRGARVHEPRGDRARQEVQLAPGL